MRARGRIAAVITATALLLTGCTSLSPTTDGTVGPVSCTGDAIGSWNATQTAVARAIVEVALGLDLGEKGATIGVAVGITESTLQALNYGDQYLDGSGMTTSRGPFQQKQEWGSLADRLDPAKAAKMFYTGGAAGQKGLMDIDGWQDMPPHQAAQAVQRSQFTDGSNFARNMAEAETLTKAIISGCRSPGADGVNLANGVQVTLPNNQFVAEAVRGKTITAPSEAMARGLAAGFDKLGMPYVWGGTGDDGCPRGGGQLNSCQGLVGYDCSGFTSYVLGVAGFQIPGNSSSQRAAGVKVPVNEALPGDLLGWSGHIALSLGRVDGTHYMMEFSTVGQPGHIVATRMSGIDSSAHRYWSGSASA